MENRQNKTIFRVMIIDPDVELRELTTLFVSEVLGAELAEFAGAESAIENLKQCSSKPDLVISDFQLSDGSGALIENFLRSHSPEVHFLLLTSDDQKVHPQLLDGNTNRAYLQKPYDSHEFQSIITAILEKNKDKPITKSDYIPIPLGVLNQLQNIPCALYLKIGPDHFVKALNAQSVFGEANFQRLKAKSIAYLFVERENLSKLLGDFREQALSKHFLQMMKTRPREIVALSKGVKEFLLVAAKTMKWSQDINRIGEENIRMVQNIVASKKGLQSVLDWFADPNTHERGLSSGFFLSYVLADLVRKLKVPIPGALEKLTLAAFFHDMALDEYHLLNQANFVNAIRVGGATSRESIEIIRNHPQKAWEELQGWKQCSPDVLRIISEHHELPNGAGFPKGLQEQYLHPLSKIFIVANELNEIFHRVRDKKGIKEELIKRAPVFDFWESRKIFGVALKSLGAD